MSKTKTQTIKTRCGEYDEIYLDALVLSAKQADENDAIRHLFNDTELDFREEIKNILDCDFDFVISLVQRLQFLRNIQCSVTLLKKEQKQKKKKQ